MRRATAWNKRALIRIAILCCFAACGDGDGVIAPVRTVAGTATHDIRQPGLEVFEFGDFALYAPAGVATVRGLILALGGPDTRGFVTGGPMGARSPELEASLQTLGHALRTLAATHGLAVLGTAHAAMTNSSGSDQLLLNAIQTGAAMSGRPALPAAPVILYGISGGARQASGFTARNPRRVAGLFLKVPAQATAATSGSALGVPAYIVLGELDTVADNAAIAAAFEVSRRSGALWALAEEPGVPHHSLTPAQRQVTINWIRTILELRLPAVPSDPLREIDETSGWLGNRSTGAATPWAAYPGDRALASWLPSQVTAEDWAKLVATSGTAPSGRWP